MAVDPQERGVAVVPSFPSQVLIGGDEVGLGEVSQELGDGMCQPPELLMRQAVRRPCRVDPRLEEDLVGVDVPDPGDDGLVQEAFLDCAMRTADPFLEVSRVEGRVVGLRPQPSDPAVVLLVRAEEPEPPEAAHVGEAHLRPVVHVQDDMGVSVLRVSGRCGHQAAGHAHVHGDVRAVVQACDEVLPAPVYPEYGPAGQALGERRCIRMSDDSGVPHIDGLYRPTCDERLHRPPRGLDLRKLGHGEVIGTSELTMTGVAYYGRARAC